MGWVESKGVGRGSGSRSKGIGIGTGILNDAEMIEETMIEMIVEDGRTSMREVTGRIQEHGEDGIGLGMVSKGQGPKAGMARVGGAKIGDEKKAGVDRSREREGAGREKWSRYDRMRLPTLFIMWTRFDPFACRRISHPPALQRSASVNANLSSFGNLLQIDIRVQSTLVTYRTTFSPRTH